MKSRNNTIAVSVQNSKKLKKGKKTPMKNNIKNTESAAGGKMMEKKNIRVACYARYSTNMQCEESIIAQLRAMEAYCQQQGWIIVKKYVDEAYSATTDKRPQFQQMISDSAKNVFDIVLVHKLNRFSRNLYNACLYKQELQKNGVRLCSVLEHIDNTPESILLEGLLESINEFCSATNTYHLVNEDD